MKERLSKKDRMAIVVMPLVIVAVTAVAGTAVGVWFQNRSFKRNELFRVRLERLMWLHNEAVQILREVDTARRNVRTNEDVIATDLRKAKDRTERLSIVDFYRGQDLMKESLIQLKEARVRLDSLVVDTDALTNDARLKQAVGAYAEKHALFVTCVEQNSQFAHVCSDEHADLIKRIREVVAAHGASIDQFVRDYD